MAIRLRNQKKINLSLGFLAFWVASKQKVKILQTGQYLGHLA